MLNPSVIDLLVGVADGLQAEVLDELPAGPARDQVQAAIAIVRRVARALPGLVPYLEADIADLRATLEELAALDGGAAPDGGAPPDDGRTPREGRSASLDVLLAESRGLRERLADHIEGGELGAAADATVRAALARLTERDRGLRLSPWER